MGKVEKALIQVFNLSFDSLDDMVLSMRIESRLAKKTQGRLLAPAGVLLAFAMRQPAAIEGAREQNSFFADEIAAIEAGLAASAFDSVLKQREVEHGQS